MSRRSATAAAWGLVSLAGLLLGTTGCVPSSRPPMAHSRTVTPHYPASELVAVVDGPSAGQSLARLIALTARPNEELDALAAAPEITVLAAGVSPGPVSAVIPVRPASPGAGATDFQQAQSHRDLIRWAATVTHAKRAAAARTGAVVAAWVRRLGLAAKIGRLPRPAGPSVSLAAESSVAASALLRIDNAVRIGPGGGRVVLLYAGNLAGRLPPGVLSGADVIVVLPYALSARAIGSAQTRLLRAGAAGARIAGPDTTMSQLAALVSAGLSHRAITDRLSAAALFRNGQARLTPGAARVLLPLIAPLRLPGASAVINGYASTPGRRRANDLLSFARAAAVASFLEAHGVPASALQVVGHGSTGLVGPGASAANRRVVVIIEEPASGGGTAR